VLCEAADIRTLRRRHVGHSEPRGEEELAALEELGRGRSARRRAAS
jgi:hypothetical protein